jgi:mannose-6-phosphate isomerase-like protein (cupin superfamily)
MLPPNATPSNQTESVRLDPPAFATPPATPIIVPADSPERFQRGGFGVNWKIDGAHTAGRFSIVHHPLGPRALAAPLHRHHREDEYSYVLSGTLGALLGDDVVTAGPGTWVFKPREQWHTFWNAGDVPCEIIEVISPAGFEDYFRKLAAAWPDFSKFGEIARAHELDMDLASVPGLCERFGLRM